MSQRTPSRIWVDNPADFSTSQRCAINHSFHEHPLMQLDALQSLANVLFLTRQCRFIDRETTQTSQFRHLGRTLDGRSVTEVFRNIEEPRSWIALYNIETHPPYREFLAEIADAFRGLVSPEQKEIFNVGGFVFISAPPSVTPFHIDRENNFWLQIRGEKILSVWDHTDREVVSATDVEDFIVNRNLENVRLTANNESRRRDFLTRPGMGVYFPSTSPHSSRTVTDWVKPGDGVSISIGVVFYTEKTRQQARIHQMNHWIRQYGRRPTPPGDSAWRDAIKAPLGKYRTLWRQRFTVYTPPPGF